MMENVFKTLRKQKGLTQREMQLETGIDQSLISKYETGKRLPPRDTLVLLADYFDTTIDDLLGKKI